MSSTRKTEREVVQESRTWKAMMVVSAGKIHTTCLQESTDQQEEEEEEDATLKQNLGATSQHLRKGDKEATEDTKTEAWVEGRQRKA